MKRTLEKFLYDKIVLRLLTEEGLEDTLSWRNHYKEWFNDTKTIQLRDHINWFKKYEKLDNDFIFIIEDNEQNKIGQVAIYNIDWHLKSGEFGRFLVNPLFAGKKYMKLACDAAIMLAKTQLNLKKLYLEVKPNNHKAIYIYQNCGFTMKDSNNKNVFMEKILGC